jgi:hypothetical protein
VQEKRVFDAAAVAGQAQEGHGTRVTGATGGPWRAPVRSPSWRRGGRP